MVLEWKGFLLGKDNNADYFFLVYIILIYHVESNIFHQVLVDRWL